MTLIRAFAIACLLGCHAQPPLTIPVEDSWVQIVDATYARTHSNVTKHVALPFAFLKDGVNGTQLMLQFLDAADQKGARYASNISIVLQMKHDGAAIECVSKVVPEGSAGGAEPVHATPSTADDSSAGSTTIRPWTPDLVTAQVDDHAFECARVAERIEVLEPKPENFFSAESRFLEESDKTPTPLFNLVTADWHDACHLVKQHHEVRRYQHFVMAHFQPPDWDKLGKVFASQKLVELPPECHAIATVTRPVQRVEADFSYSGERPALRTKPMYTKLKAELAYLP